MIRIISILNLLLIALLIGMNFVLIPSISYFLTSEFNLTFAEYGELFLPMSIGAIVASFYSGRFSQTFGAKQIIIIGLCFNILGMISLSYSLSFISFRYEFLLLAMFGFGVGLATYLSLFSLYVIYYFPRRANRVISFIYLIMGSGMIFTPLFVNQAIELNMWWFIPIALGLLYLLSLTLVWAYLPTHLQRIYDDFKTQKRDKNKFYVSIMAVLYGFIEASFTIWLILFLNSEMNFLIADAAKLFSLFWVSFTLGRFWLYFLPPISNLGLPIILVVGLLGFFFIKSFAFIPIMLCGLGCSGMLPLIVQVAERQFPSQVTYMNSLITVMYMIGYALCAEGMAILYQDRGLSLFAFYIILIVPVSLLGFLIFRNAER